MAMTGGPFNLRELTEELTVQHVLLDSIQAESWPGIEIERKEITDCIERLNLQIRQLRHGPRPPTSSDAAVSPRALGSTDSPAAKSSTVRSNPQLGTPSIGGDQSSNMDSSSRINDVQDSHVTMRSRKRYYSEHGTEPVDDRMKSRRTTPNPVVNPASGPSRYSRGTTCSQSPDVIDLTGDDVDEDAWCVSQQLIQAKRQAVENQDRQMAMQLSGRQLPVPSSLVLSSSSNPKSAPRSAFSRIMETQRLNTRSPTNLNGNLAATSNASLVPTREPHKLTMPGTYEVNWDLAAAQQFGVRGFNSNDCELSHAKGHAHTSPGSSQSPRPGLRPVNDQLVLRSNASNSMFSESSQQAMNLVSNFSRTANFAQASGSSMSRIINKTSMYDFNNGVDMYGNPLSSRFSHALYDDYDSPATGKELDDLLRNIRPDLEIPMHNREIGPEGLQYRLYRHQVVALTWMKKMEEGTNKGGILADDMGLGKTISTLALMLANPAKSHPKTNLIIGPLSLIRQWEEEIAKKIKSLHKLSVFVYHGKKTTTEELLQFDVVLTTYGTIAQESTRLDQFMEDNKDRNIDFNDRAHARKFPLLNPGKAGFHRVILDEAQCIKNRNTKTAKACHRLKSNYRWCLTGTPMMNGVLELYSLLRFLRIRPYNSWDHFRQAFGMLFGQKGDPRSVAMDRLRALLKAVMLRRKKDSQLDGRPILQLPPKTEEIVYAELSTEERDFYKQLEEKAQVMFSTYLREGSVGKNYSSILVLLLRLRQTCCHPHLNLDVDDAASTGVGSDENVEQLVRDLNKTIVERIKALENFECPICYDVVQSPCFFIPCGHDSCRDCLIRVTDGAISQNIHEGHESDKAKCPVCRGIFEPRKCFTYDMFKKIHMPEDVEKLDSGGSESGLISDESGSGEEGFESEDDDEVDNEGNLKGFVVADDVEDNADKDNGAEELGKLNVLKREASSLEQEEGKQQEEEKRKREKKRKRKKKKDTKRKRKEQKSDIKPSMLKSLRLEAIKNQDAYKKYMAYLRESWMPAAKVTECMKLLTMIQDTGDKTIVFSQWTLLLDLLEVAMWHEKFEHDHIRYDGSMSGDERSIAAKSFRDNPKIKVMLVSLRAGNAGLNLTAANRVIIMDPFWNPYIEMQAIDRTYRIGQQREVKVYRILTRKTVEDRIVQLQEKKKEIVEAALDETESMKIGRLNVSELKFLFDTS